MITIRRSGERGSTRLGWLDSRHTFSFGNYYDPAHMGFSSLRVINDDRIAPGAGFDTHAHRDMEIVTFILDGELEHKDSMGTGSIIRRGEIQLMRAGTGVAHSEFNPSTRAPVHLLQIWIEPDTPGLPPAYGQQRIDLAAARTGFARLVSKDGTDGSLRIHQDVDVWLGDLDSGAERSFELRPARSAWIHVARGSVSVSGSVSANGIALGDGDAAAIRSEEAITLRGDPSGEVLLFDLA